MAPSLNVAVCLALHALLASALLDQKSRPGRFLALHDERLASIPVHLYKEDCWKQRHVRMALAQHAQAAQTSVEKPGAGMEPSKIQPFTTVLKDGFYPVDCVKDYMFYHGDKFGDNRHSYELGNVANVSIVHYTDVVAKEDRETMTHAVCFDFCRTVPDMSFFGVAHGRDCYCTPYFKMMADDSSDCDAVCDGDKGTMCGGASKSSVFQMHMCDNTQQDLQDAVSKMGEVSSYVDGRLAEASRVSFMQPMAADLQEALGNAGDPVAADLMQVAKVFAGVIEKEAGDTNQAFEKMRQLKDQADNTNTSAAHGLVVDAERLTTEIEVTTSAAQAAVEKLDQSLELASPSGDASNNAAAQYVSVMYFVDKELENKTTTCGGKMVDKPVYGKDMNGCAAACDADVHSCTGFSFYPESNGHHLCFLFSKVETATYYSGCSGMSLLAQDGGASEKKSEKKGIKGKLRETADEECLHMETRVLAVGDKVVARWAPNEGKADNPWFSGVVTSLAGTSYEIAYSDGQKGSVSKYDIYYAPNALDNVGEGDHRLNDLCAMLDTYGTGRFRVGPVAGAYEPMADAAKSYCQVKFSEFEGGTLKPDDSGKCKACLKEVTIKDRCF